jgi:hypothetical protein
MPGGGAVSSALDTLASFSVVGVRHESDKFLSAFAELMGVDAATLPPIQQFPGVPRLAGVLKESGALDGLLERDLELYHHVLEANEKAK